jgi:hypothetical protein
VYFLPADGSVPRVAPDPVTLPRTLLTATGLIGRSPRHAVAGYFAHHGLPHRSDGDRLHAQLPGGSAAEVSFDALGRIADIRVTGAGTSGTPS